jgi:hypothetical protein
MQGRPKAIIAGFGCKPPSLDYLRLPSVEITEGGPKRDLGTEALSRAEPEVRIHFPPAASHPRRSALCRAFRANEAGATLERLFAANPEFSSSEADLLAARILETKGRSPEALSAYERLSATYPGEEAKSRMALLQRTGAEQRARAIFAEIRKSVERSPAFYRRAQREWYEIARRHA